MSAEEAPERRASEGSKEGPSVELLVRFRAGEEAAAQELEALLQEPLARFATGYLRDVGEAEDLVQEVWAKLLASETLPDNPRLWIYRIARNACLNRLRTRERRGNWVPLPTDVQISARLTGHLTRLLAAEDHARLVRALDRLNGAQREVLELRYGEGLSRTEIAQLIDVPESVVKSRIYEGLKKLRSATEHDRDVPRP